MLYVLARDGVSRRSVNRWRVCGLSTWPGVLVDVINDTCDTITACVPGQASWIKIDFLLQWPVLVVLARSMTVGHLCVRILLSEC